MPSTVVSFRDLKVWQLGMDLVVRVYSVTQTFPTAERYGLCSQMRRASLSIPSNVAEGHARREGAYLNHVRISLGSQAELLTQVEVARRLGYVSDQEALSLDQEIDRIRQLLHGLRRSLERERTSPATVTSAAAFMFLMGSLVF